MQRELLKYHPNRYFHNMENFITEAVGDYYEKHDEQSREKLKGLLLGTIFSTNLNLKLEQSPDYNGVMPSNKMREWSEYKEEIFSTYSEYFFGGSNIFHIRPFLFDMFLQSSVDDVKLQKIKLPYNSFYLHWGRQQELKISDKTFLDGAYIEISDKEDEFLIFFYLTTFNEDYNYYKNDDELKFLFNDTHYYNVFLFENNEDIKTVLEHTLGSDLSDSFGEITLEKIKPILKETFNILVNSLLYISTYKSEIIYRYPEETPKNLLKKLEKASTEKQIRKAESRIKNFGFNKIFFCGDRYENNISLSHSDRKLATHWRRGHWRNQAIGENYSEHKVVWIKPTIVNKNDKPDDKPPEIKHIYDTNKGGS